LVPALLWILNKQEPGVFFFGRGRTPPLFLQPPTFRTFQPARTDLKNKTTDKTVPSPGLLLATSPRKPPPSQSNRVLLPIGPFLRLQIPFYFFSSQPAFPAREIKGVHLSGPYSERDRTLLFLQLPFSPSPPPPLSFRCGSVVLTYVTGTIEIVTSR